MAARLAAVTCTGAAAAASSPALSPASFFEQPVMIKRTIRDKYAYLLMAGILLMSAELRAQHGNAQARRYRHCELHWPWSARPQLPMPLPHLPDSAGSSGASSQRKGRKRTGVIRFATTPSVPPDSRT